MSLSLLNRTVLGAGLLVASFIQPAAASSEPKLNNNAPASTTSAASAAANLITGSFTGQLVDQQTRLPLSNVSVAILRSSDEQLIAGALTANNGEFRLDRASFGHYTLHIEVPGYQPLHEKITIAAGRDVIDLGAFDLKPLSTVAVQR